MRFFREHAFACRAALARIAAAPGSFIFNVLVIALALILPLGGLTLLDNVRPVTQGIAVEPEISVFLSTDAPGGRIQAIGDEIRGLIQREQLKAKVEFVSRDKALDSLKKRAGLGDIVATLGNNPLPDAYVLKLASAEDAAGASRIVKLAEGISKLSGVEVVQMDSAWVKRLAALITLATTVLWLLAATLCGVVLAVVFNTIRLQVLTQSEEIAVSRLLGATDAFVSRPFYYTGAMLGLASGALALAGMLLALLLLNTSVTQLAALYGSPFRLLPLPASTTGMLLAGSAALGVLGAALSVRRCLRQPS
jgi:cell division transport system permease protein